MELNQISPAKQDFNLLLKGLGVVDVTLLPAGALFAAKAKQPRTKRVRLSTVIKLEKVAN
jgi:hypothetical protein